MIRVSFALAAALGLGLLAGCPGHLDDPARFIDAGGTSSGGDAEQSGDDAGRDADASSAEDAETDADAE